MKKHLPLLVGLGLPILLMIVLALFTYWPQFTFTLPTQDIVYTNQDAYSPRTDSGSFEVKDGKVVYTCYDYSKAKDIGTAAEKTPCEPKSDVTLYKYSFKTNTSTRLTYKQAQELSLDSNDVSIDGYYIDYDYSYGGLVPELLFSSGSSNRNSFYVAKGRARKAITIPTPAGRSTYGSFNFLGWIN